MLSESSSLKSTYSPCLIFPITLAGIGGKDGEITSGVAGACVGADGEADRSAASDGIDQEVPGPLPLLPVDRLGGTVVGVRAPEKRGTPAMDDAGGRGGVPPPAPLEVGGTETPVEVKPEIKLMRLRTSPLMCATE